jgi:hypothetical protein
MANTSLARPRKRLFDGVEKQRRAWCLRRFEELEKWVIEYGRNTKEMQLDAALERIAGLESLLHERDALSFKVGRNVRF